MTARVLRFPDAGALVVDAAQRLLEFLVERQSRQDQVHLCLSGGHTTSPVYDAFAGLDGVSAVDPSRLHLWWANERFVDAVDPDRLATQSLAFLARRLPLVSSQVHPMPPLDGRADASEAAYVYTQELGDTVFDLTLLGMGADGHVAAIYPAHAGLDATGFGAIGVSGGPNSPPERVSLTIPTLNRSRQIWLMVTGAEKADAVARALDGDASLPAGRITAQERTVWFVDADSAAQLPQYRCEL